MMGMPTITPGTTERTQAVTDVIEAIALQEAALSHILNAAGEKMQAVISMEGVSAEELLEMNRSVERLLGAVTRMEILLHSKLELIEPTKVTAGV